MTPNKHMLRAVTHNVVGRVRGRLLLDQVICSGVPLAQRTGTDVSR